ncbi:MAG: oligosaccharide flippase family protein [Pyrinomonadaceae bacterium]
MGNNLTKKSRLLKNTAFSIFSWVFPLCLAFISTPLLVKGLGNEQYGIYAIALGFVSFAFSSGVGRIAAKYIAELRASGETEKLSEAVSATIWLTVVIGLLQAIILALAAPYIVSEILLISPDTGKQVLLALYLAAAGGMFLMISYVFQFMLHGISRFDRLAWITNLSAVLLNAGNVLLMLYGFGVLVILIWNAIVFALIGFLYYWGSMRLLPEFHFVFRINKGTAKSVAAYASSIVLYQALTSILFIFERTWIVRKFGPEALTFYVVPLMLAIYMHGLLASFVQVLFPVVNELLLDLDKLKRLYQKSTKAAFVIIVFIVGTYVAGGKMFLQLWMNDEFAERSYSLLLILSITFGINAVGMIVWQLAEAFKYPGLNAFSAAIWMIVSIPLMAAAADGWQMEGIAFARLLGVLPTIPMIFYIEKRFLGHIFLGFWLGMIFRAAIAACAMIIVESQLLSRFGTGWLSLASGFASGTIVFCSVLVLLGFITRDERIIIREMLFRNVKPSVI